MKFKELREVIKDQNQILVMPVNHKQYYGRGFERYDECDVVEVLPAVSKGLHIKILVKVQN